MNRIGRKDIDRAYSLRVKDSMSSQSPLSSLSYDNAPAPHFSLTLSMLTTN